MATIVRQKYSQKHSPKGVYGFVGNTLFLYTNQQCFEWRNKILFTDEEGYLIRKNESEWAHRGMQKVVDGKDLEDLIVATEEEIKLAKLGQLTLRGVMERRVISPERFKEIENYLEDLAKKII